MNKYLLLSVFVLVAMISSCIKDDFLDDRVDPEIRITNTIDTIEINTTFQFEGVFFNNVGREEEVDIIWESSRPDIISIDQNGLAFAFMEGVSIISATYTIDNETVRDEVSVAVGDNTVIMLQSTTGEVETTTFYVLEGSFTFNETATGVKLIHGDDFRASSGLPGFYVYLSNNKFSIADAVELGEITVFNGTQSFEVENVGFADFQYLVYFCKPFNIKVGEASL